ncbi:zf-HC2 domain-containing protein [Streptomyces sp. NPDC047108]|uniref:anti-sigma factor family protein n=1 Tax=Streptomyces sp. NPDC047108 TaxID=3155025 RepID=UPI00340391F5
MTSSTGTDQHPDVADISDLAEGILPPDRTSEVREHLDGCELCRDILDSLEEIRGLLGTLPGPATMPADVARRIDAALAAEALLDATAPTVSRETGPATTADPQDAAKPDAVSRETATPTRPPRATDRPQGRPRAATGPGRKSRGRRTWRTAVFGAACALAAIGLGGVMVNAINDADGGSSEHPAMADRSEAQEKSDLAGSGLEPKVQHLLDGAHTRAPSSSSSRGIGPESSPNKTMRGDDAIVPSCVRAGIGRTDDPIASEEITYRGTESYLVLLPRPSDSSRVDVYVVDSSCTGKSPQGSGEVLLKDVYQRG